MSPLPKDYDLRRLIIVAVAATWTMFQLYTVLMECLDMIHPAWCSCGVWCLPGIFDISNEQKESEAFN